MVTYWGVTTATNSGPFADLLTAMPLTRGNCFWATQTADPVLMSQHLSKNRLCPSEDIARETT